MLESQRRKDVLFSTLHTGDISFQSKYAETPASVVGSMKRMIGKAVAYIEQRSIKMAHDDLTEETEESRKYRQVCLLVLHYTYSPLSNYYLAAHCDWMQAFGP